MSSKKRNLPTDEEPLPKKVKEEKESASILQILKPSKVLKTKEDFQKEFDRVAEILLNQSAIYINDQPHRLVEIEFYYRDNNYHQDVFTHCDDFQKKLGYWYFHRAGNGGSYKGGSYKGLDISYGNKDAFAGILIRSIGTLDMKTIIEGPCLCVDHILALNKASSIDQLVQSFPDGQELVEKRENSPLYLALLSDMEKKILYQSPRIGLTLKKSDNIDLRVQYIMTHYRYLTAPDLKKGRPHIVLGLLLSGKSAEEIHKTTKIPLKSILSYSDYFEKGKKKKPNNFFSKALNTQDICQLYGACNLSP